jgi:hypothetical protein
MTSSTVGRSWDFIPQKLIFGPPPSTKACRMRASIFLDHNQSIFTEVCKVIIEVASTLNKIIIVWLTILRSLSRHQSQHTKLVTITKSKISPADHLDDRDVLYPKFIPKFKAYIIFRKSNYIKFN